MKFYIKLTDINEEIEALIEDSILEKKYNSIEEAVRAYTEAISAIDDDVDTSFGIDIFNENNDLIDGQRCEKEPYSGDFVLFTYGVIGYRTDDNGIITDSDLLAEGINTYQEACEIAQSMTDVFHKYDTVKIETYTQTLYENIGDVYFSHPVYP
jgi:hypothetical protein